MCTNTQVWLKAVHVHVIDINYKPTLALGSTGNMLHGGTTILGGHGQAEPMLLAICITAYTCMYKEFICTCT